LARRNWGTFADKTLLVIAGALLAAQQNDVPSEKLWTDLLQGRGYLLVGTIVVVGIVGVLNPFQAIASRGLTDRALALQRHILHALGAIIDLTCFRLNPPLPINDVGLHVWKVRRTFQHPVQGELSRVGTFRLGSTPLTRQVTFTKNKGVVGLCWAQNREVAIDVEALARTIRNEAAFKRQVEKHGADSVMGFDWGDFETVKHRGAVLAAPIRNRRHKFIGCVSVDLSTGFAVLYTPDVLREVQRLCNLISEQSFAGLTG
jgi:hypothetical protein